VAGIAAATLPASKVKWRELIEDYDRIRDRIEAVLPDFARYNERIREPGGFRLPLPPTLRVWATPSGKAQFLAAPDSGAQASRGAGLRLTTIRSHDQYNTTIYGYDDRYRGVFGRRDVVFVNEQDLAACGIAHGDRIDIETTFGNAQELRLCGFTAVAYEIARGSIAAYYPEANALVPLDHHDPDSGTPSYKSVPVMIRPAGSADAPPA
jgi:anaerobic selenocysteine-containing dehydrogenase